MEPAEADAATATQAGFPALMRSTQAIVLVSVIVILVSVSMFVVYEAANRRSRASEARQVISSISLMLAEEVGRILDVANLVAGHAIEISRNRSWDDIEQSRAIFDELARLDRAYSFISAIWLTDASGMPRQSTRSFPPPHVSVADREHFKVQREADRGPFVSPLVRSRVRTEANIVMSRRIQDTSGGFQGVALVVLDPQYFLRLYREIQVEYPVAIEVVRFDRSILLRAPTAAVEESLDAVKSTGPALEATSAASGLFAAKEPGESGERMQAYRRVEGFPLYVVVSVLNADVAQSWLSAMYVHGGFAALGLVAALAALALAHAYGRREQQTLRDIRGLNASLEMRVKERTQALEHLLQEVTHRVKNSLQLTASLLRLQQNNVRDQPTREYLSDAQTRVLTIARLHEHLYQAGNFRQVELKRYLGTICADVGGALPGHQISFKSSFGSALVPVDLAIPIALVLTELLTNAMKHAFSGDAGSVAVSLDGDGESGRLEVADNGRGLPLDFDLHQAQGLGMRIVLGLVKQANGEISVDSGQTGTRFEVRFPLSGGGGP
ncbi:MAG: hypothetical protein IT563_22175 [Alphaproteobacteria bacterium]|nr:hypothetical protein [Alphaproteobacteria bacterium]